MTAKVVPTAAEVLTAQELTPCCIKAYPARNANQHQVDDISEVMQTVVGITLAQRLLGA